MGALWALGCGAAPRLVADAGIVDIHDPAGDVRLQYPPHPTISTADFDLRRLTIGTNDRFVVVEAEFARRVVAVAGVRLTEDKRRDVFPQTVDVYVDIEPGAGHIEALEGRGFHVPAAQAWDKVLLLSSIQSLRHPDVVRPVHLTARGRVLKGVFRRSEVGGPILGVLAVVLATAPLGEGRVRQARTFRGNCEVWEQHRCTLIGEGPPILDATGPVVAGRPLALRYRRRQQPAEGLVPVVFARGGLVSAAPVNAAEVAAGQLATILDSKGDAVATAVVVSVVGDTASLKVLGTAGSVDGAVSVTFGSKGRE